MTTMTTTTEPTATAAPKTAARGEVTQRRVFRSEWIKLWTLRSTFWTLIGSMVALVGLAVLFCALNESRWPRMSPHEQATFDPSSTALGSFFFAQLPIGVLGVLTVTGEYATGMIRATLGAVPRRLPVLWAKAGIFTAVVWVLMTLSSLVAFVVGQALLSPRHIGLSLGDPGALRTVVGTGLYLTVVGLLGVGIGAMLRNTAGGITTLFGVLLILPVLAEPLPRSWANAIDPWLPSNAGRAVFALHHAAHTLHPWAGFAVFLGYALAALAGAAALLRRRDA